jgi:hypothetical protein
MATGWLKVITGIRSHSPAFAPAVMQRDKHDRQTTIRKNLFGFFIRNPSVLFDDPGDPAWLHSWEMPTG